MVKVAYSKGAQNCAIQQRIFIIVKVIPYAIEIFTIKFTQICQHIFGDNNKNVRDF